MGAFVEGWRDVNGAVGNGLAAPLKVNHRIAIGSSYFISDYMPKRTRSRGLNGYKYTHVHSNTTPNHQQVKTARCL